MKKNILLIACLLSTGCACLAQNGTMKVNISNTPLYTLFSPMTFARNSTTSALIGAPALTTATSGNTLTLTNSVGCEGVASTFNNTFNPSKDWQLRFTYTLTSPGGTAANADGIAVVIHNDSRGTGAVGGSGLYLGCDLSDAFCANSSTAIHRSMQWQFEIFSGTATYGATLKTSVGTAVPSVVSGPTVPSPVVIASNTPIDITMRYVASTNALTVTLNDGTNTKVFTYTINMSTLVGASGYLAFTAGTGGLSSTQTITKVFMFGYNL